MTSPQKLGQLLTKKTWLIFVLFLFVVVGSCLYYLSQKTQLDSSLLSELKSAKAAGLEVGSDLRSLPTSQITDKGQTLEVVDNLTDGPQVSAGSTEDLLSRSPASPGAKRATGLAPRIAEKFVVNFPKDIADKIEVKLDGQRSFFMTDKSSLGFAPRILDSQDELMKPNSESQKEAKALTKANRDVNSKTEIESVLANKAGQDVVKYQDINQRKAIYYAYQKDQKLSKRKLKNWIVYASGNGAEREEYVFENVKLKKTSNGDVEGYYLSPEQLKNEEVKTQVDGSLLERARLTLKKEAGQDLDKLNQKPDFIIPRPYIIDAERKKTLLDWTIDSGQAKLSINFKVTSDQYPLALDPTLEFTAPGQSDQGVSINGEANSAFGTTMTTGDFNNDGKTDLAIGATEYNLLTGRVYIFYNDGSLTPTADTADVVIDGLAAGDLFGTAMATGDFNNDGKTDLVVGAPGSGTNMGRAYIFYNDGSMPTTASTADISIAGEVANDFFTQSLTAGDFNNDGKTDLVVGAPGSGTNMGRAYIFYNDGSMPTTASTADIIITGQNASDNFGVAMLVSDFNNDNRPDLVVGANGFNLSAGRIYIFNNDGSMPTTASTADQIVTGEVMNSAFGSALTVGDFNANGKKDLAVGASMYGISTGRVYVFEQISALPAVASSAEIIITGETNSNFGEVIASADLDSDNKIDLVASAPGLNSNTGAIYIFYNNQTLTQTASTADVIIKGENTGDAFGQMLGALDLNSDKKLDLITSAYLGSGDGRVYGFYSNNGFMDSGSTLSLNKSNEVIAPYFGGTIVSADFNNDGKVDLAVSANNAITYYDVVYIFYSDGSLPSTSDQADLKITSEDDKGRFGYAMITGDLNNDGRVDLIVGDYLVSSSMGKVYVFYNDGSMPTSAANADLIITGEANSYFGEAMTMCDMNADGKLDLIVGATMYNAYQGAVYIFYNDGIIPSLAMNADKNILGGAAGEAFGYVIVALDLNNDGQNDLAVGATSYNSSMGRVYVFYNDGNLPATGAAADIIINGQATGDNFGYSLAVGDFNNDGKTDLVVGAYRSLSNGAVYIFYNDGSIPGSAGSAELIITDNVNSWFGYTLLAGDFNNDGKTDLAVSGQYYSTYTGHVYIFYNDGSMPTSAANADVIISGETTNTQFGWTMFQADFNFDGKPDLVIGGPNYGASLGAVYVFYNDGSLTSTAANADKKIIGAHNLNERFGYSMLLADINKDGLTDLIVGAPYYLNIGRVYIFYGTLDKSTEPDVKIDGNALGFGSSLTLGDFNGDGWSDLAVGSPNISSNMGQVLVFYNDGSMPLTAQTADVVFSGVGITNYFGYAMTSTDLNSDGRDDLVVGAYRKSNGTVYIFNGGSFVSTTSAGASTTITNSIAGYFGYAITKGDFNADGKMDLVISDYRYNTYQGVVYVLYNDGTIPTTTIKVDKRIYGTSSSDFGIALTMGDVNGDKTDDLIVGASRNAGQVFAYYVTGAMATNTSVADLRIVNTYGLTNFGCSLVVADYNNDGKNDLVIGDSGYKANAGRAYVFYNKPIMATSTLAADVVLTNHTTGNFADSMSSGDLNNDGRVDLVIGAFGDNSIYYYISKYIAPTHSIRGSFKSWGNVKLW